MIAINMDNFIGKNNKIPVQNVPSIPMINLNNIQSPKISTSNFRNMSMSKSLSTKYDMSKMIPKNNQKEKIKIKLLSTSIKKTNKIKINTLKKNFVISKDKPKKNNDIFSKVKNELEVYDHIFSENRIKFSKEAAKKREKRKFIIKNKNYIDAGQSFLFKATRNINDIYKPKDMNLFLAKINDSDEYKNNILRIKETHNKKMNELLSNKMNSGILDKDILSLSHQGKKMVNSKLNEKNEIRECFSLSPINKSKSCTDFYKVNENKNKTLINWESNSYWEPKNSPGIGNFSNVNYSIINPGISNSFGMTKDKFLQINKNSGNNNFFRNQVISEYTNLNNPYTGKENNTYFAMFNNQNTCFRKKKLLL